MTRGVLILLAPYKLLVGIIMCGSFDALLEAFIVIKTFLYLSSNVFVWNPVP